MRVAIALVALMLAGTAMAQTPVADLAKPPPDAQQFTILSTAGRHGQSMRWTAPDGARMGRESLLLRGQVFETDSAARLGADHMLERVTIRGVTPNGDAAESFTVVGGKATGRARWTAPPRPIRRRRCTSASAGRWTSPPIFSRACWPRPAGRWPCCPAGAPTPSR